MRKFRSQHASNKKAAESNNTNCTIDQRTQRTSCKSTGELFHHPLSSLSNLVILSRERAARERLSSTVFGSSEQSSSAVVEKDEEAAVAGD